MRFEEAMKAMREGKEVRRKSWDKDVLYVKINKNAYPRLGLDELVECAADGNRIVTGFDIYSILADDWEIVEEKPHRKIVVECTVGGSPCIAKEIVGENCLFLCLSIDKKEEFHGRKIKVMVETVD